MPAKETIKKTASGKSVLSKSGSCYYNCMLADRQNLMGLPFTVSGQAWGESSSNYMCYYIQFGGPNQFLAL